MFGRKKSDTPDEKAAAGLGPVEMLAPLSPSAPKPAPPNSAPPTLPRPPIVLSKPPLQGPLMPPLPATPAAAQRPTEPLRAPIPSQPPKPEKSEMRQLIVGREISLTGEINSCDKLLVEGNVQANLTNCKEVEIAETGLFKGTAIVDDIEIRGRFEGTLTVTKRLLIRATGKIEGTVVYGQIEIECGGQISGDIKAEPLEAPAPAPAVEPAPDLMLPRRERVTPPILDIAAPLHS